MLKPLCFALLFLMLVIACKSTTRITPSVAPSTDSPIRYSVLRERISDSLPYIRKAGVRQQQQSFKQIVFNKLIPQWVGTPWDFNGTSKEPRQGNIACGYFVTTILQDAGVRLNRAALAQMPSLQMMQTLSSKRETENLSGLAYDDFIKHCSAHKDAVYIVGLDFHVGFLIEDQGNLYFAHSNYINKQGVTIEDATSSLALKASKTRYVLHLNNSNTFMQKWLSN